MTRSLLVALALLGLSCAPAPLSAPAQPPPAVAPAVAPAAATPPAARGARLAVTLRPLIEPARRVHVEVMAEGDSADLRAWALGGGSTNVLRDVSARDDDGAIPFAERRGADVAGVTLARPPRGPVRMSYDVPAVDDAGASPLAVMVGQSAMRAAGEDLILMPSAYDDRAVSIALRIEAEAIGASGAASSLGIGASRERTARGRFLRHAAFIAGQLGTAVFHTMEAEDEAAWIGITAFDPRAAASEAAIVRGVVETFFGGRDPGPVPLLIVGHVRPARLWLMRRRSESMLLDVGMGEPWGPGPRVAVAHQIVQKWIGGAVWVGPDDPAHEAESYWFSEGVARFFAREILFRVGLLEPDELRDSIAADLGTLYTSPLRGEPNATVAAQVQREGALALLVARGSLYAIGVQARIRRQSHGKKSLDAVMLALLRDARDGHRRVLPVGAWVDAVKAELGEEEARTFEQAIVHGQAPPIPPDALGPCFRRAEGRYARFDLGFDEPATRAAADHAVVGLRRGGPAARAGVRAGDVIVRASFEPGSPQAPATVELSRGGKPENVTYLPAGEGVPGPAWVRRKEVPNDRCRP